MAALVAALIAALPCLTDSYSYPVVLVKALLVQAALPCPSRDHSVP